MSAAHSKTACSQVLLDDGVHQSHALVTSL
jgi:hypothetical protein